VFSVIHIAFAFLLLWFSFLMCILLPHVIYILLHIFMSDFQLYRIMTVVCGYEIYVEFQIQFF